MVSIPLSVWMSVLGTFVLFFLVAGAAPVVAVSLFVTMTYALAAGEQRTTGVRCFLTSCRQQVWRCC
jgi:hypothetical protein